MLKICQIYWSSKWSVTRREENTTTMIDRAIKYSPRKPFYGGCYCHVKHSILNKLFDFMNVAKKCHWLSHNLDIFPRKYFVLRMIPPWFLCTVCEHGTLPVRHVEPKS